MKLFPSGILLVLLMHAAVPAGGRSVIFLGISGENAPAIEKNLSALFEKQLASMPGVKLFIDDPLRQLQSGMEKYRFPAITASLAGALRQCGASDSALVIWARVKNSSVGLTRRLFFQAVLEGSLSLEIAVFSLVSNAYLYTGEAHASVTRKKGFVFWFGPIEKALQVSALERSEMLDTLQSGAVIDAGRTVQAILFYEIMSAAKKARMQRKIEKRPLVIAPSPEAVPQLAPRTGVKVASKLAPQTAPETAPQTAAETASRTAPGTAPKIEKPELPEEEADESDSNQDDSDVGRPPDAVKQ